MWVQSLGWEDPLERGMATHSSVLAWRSPWPEEPGGLQPIEWQRDGRDWSDLARACTHTHTHTHTHTQSHVVTNTKNKDIYKNKARFFEVEIKKKNYYHNTDALDACKSWGAGFFAWDDIYLKHHLEEEAEAAGLAAAVWNWISSRCEATLLVPKSARGM